ncbi:hypothetical protein Aduo_004258 [Ancylostoma duodenale]
MWMFYAVLVATLLEVALVVGEEKYDAESEKNFGFKVGHRVAYKRKDGTVVHHYVVEDDSVTWDEAKQVCMQESGYKLATFEDYVERRHLASEYSRKYCSECNGLYWVGDRYHENGWEVCNTISMERSEVVGVRCKNEPKPGSSNPMDVKGYVCTTTA